MLQKSFSKTFKTIFSKQLGFLASFPTPERALQYCIFCNCVSHIWLTRTPQTIKRAVFVLNRYREYSLSNRTLWPDALRCKPQLLDGWEEMSCSSLGLLNTPLLFSTRTLYGPYRSNLGALISQHVENFWTPSTLSTTFIQIWIWHQV